MSTPNALVPVQVPNLPSPGRVGQGTAVEQSRAVAEVQAAIVVAQQCPRNTDRARQFMRASCRERALADRAFYRFPRGDEVVSGASVHLAREIARCWGNFQYGITELRRDDEYGQSEMQAWAWDLETNARSSNTFIVPHVRDTRAGKRRLEDARDIYENNANQGARRLREAIFSVLPIWFTEEARSLCQQTLERGDGKPLEERIADAVAVFARMGVSEGRLVAKIGAPKSDWTAQAVAQLGVIYESVKRGEITVAEEFPEERVTVKEVTAGTNAGGSGSGKPRPERPSRPHRGADGKQPGGEQGNEPSPNFPPSPEGSPGGVQVEDPPAHLFPDGGEQG